MLIITGLGRCGTSFMIKFLKEVGFEIGKQLTYISEIRAGLEYHPAWAISRDMFNDYLSKGKPVDLDEEIDTPWWGKISLRNRMLRIDKDDVPERPQGNIDLFKDPRITWHPDIIKAWVEVRPDIKLLVLHRKIEHILKSRQKLPSAFRDPKRGDNLEEFKEDFKKFMKAVKEIKVPYKFLIFPDFLKKYDEVYTALQELGMTFEYELGKNVWDEIVDFSFISF